MLIVGGGINGCGIARDLAGRGWRVVLCEQDDLAGHTSSASTKLIHGGLRYLEHHEFSLVRKALREREVLLRSAPHIMHPLRFVMPHHPSMRSSWMIRAGLFLYDHLAKREVLPASRAVDLRDHPAGAALQPIFRRGFVYSDGWVDDARLVVLNALDAQARGARILTRSRCTAAVRGPAGWTVTLSGSGGSGAGGGSGGATRTVRARALVNAAGPWAGDLLARVARTSTGAAMAGRRLRLVKGSHIVVRRLFDHDHAYLFQNPDQRVTFAIPYQRDFTLIGTTDVEVGGPRDADAAIAPDEIDYLCAQASGYLARPVLPADVVWTYSGVRPLLDDEAGDPAAVTRDYLLERDAGGPPLLSVWGGKITTFRKLAEDAASAIGEMLGDRRRPWTASAFLAGGDLGESNPTPAGPATPQVRFAAFLARLRQAYPALPEGLLERWGRAYGGRIFALLGDVQRISSLGAEIVPGLFERELQFLHDDEWALTGDDVLWRRTKLGLQLDTAMRRRVDDWMARA